MQLFTLASESDITVPVAKISPATARRVLLPTVIHQALLLDAPAAWPSQASISALPPSEPVQGMPMPRFPLTVTLLLKLALNPVIPYPAVALLA